MKISNEIDRLLKQNLNLSHLKVINQSNLHADHFEGELSGESHFALIVVTDDFIQKKLVARHRLVYSILSNVIERGVHALALHTFTVEEWSSKKDSFDLC